MAEQKSDERKGSLPTSDSSSGSFVTMTAPKTFEAEAWSGEHQAPAAPATPATPTTPAPAAAPTIQLDPSQSQGELLVATSLGQEEAKILAGAVALVLGMADGVPILGGLVLPRAEQPGLGPASAEGNAEGSQTVHFFRVDSHRRFEAEEWSGQHEDVPPAPSDFPTLPVDDEGLDDDEGIAFRSDGGSETPAETRTPAPTPVPVPWSIPIPIKIDAGPGTAGQVREVPWSIPIPVKVEVPWAVPIPIKVEVPWSIPIPVKVEAPAQGPVPSQPGPAAAAAAPFLGGLLSPDSEKKVTELLEEASKTLGGAPGHQQVHISYEKHQHHHQSTVTQEVVGGAPRPESQSVPSGLATVVQGLSQGVPLVAGLSPQAGPGPQAGAPGAAAAAAAAAETLAGSAGDVLSKLQDQLKELGFANDHPMTEMMKQAGSAVGGGGSVQIQFSANKFTQKKTMTFEGTGNTIPPEFEQMMKSVGAPVMPKAEAGPTKTKPQQK